MSLKIEDSPSSDVPIDPGDDLDSQNVTLARALEESNRVLDTVLGIKQDMLDELERFRTAMRHELKARKRKIDLHDVLLFGGLVLAATGIAFAFHWSYSLIAIGGTLVALSLIALFRPTVKN
jgi:hypothetical protein